jgi:hypothetical protein
LYLSSAVVFQSADVPAESYKLPSHRQCVAVIQKIMHQKMLFLSILILSSNHLVFAQQKVDTTLKKNNLKK